MGKDYVSATFKFNPEHGVWEGFPYYTLHFYGFFFGHSASYKKMRRFL